MTDEWRAAFDERHEFDVYPDNFMSGLRNEFAAGWHAALKSQARALLAGKPAPVDDALKSLIDNYGRACRRDGNPAWESDEGKALAAYLAQPCGEDAANGAHGDTQILDDLSTLVVRLVRALRKVDPDSDLPGKALGYLHRKNLAPAVLRGGAFGEFARTTPPSTNSEPENKS